MPTGRQYDIFPRTFKARLLLAGAFLATLTMCGTLIALSVSVFGRIGEDPPCTGRQEREGCLQAQTELDSIAQDSCPRTGQRACFAPLGQVDPELVRDLVQYYRDEYGLDIGVLTPSAIPAEMLAYQIDGAALSAYMGTLFPADSYDPNVALIGLTPLELYADLSAPGYRLDHSDWPDHPRAVVSTYQMHSGTLFLASDGRVFSRTRKMVTKYLGLIVYGLPLSDDPSSPMYAYIRSALDLDEMEEPLPLPSR